MSLKVHFLHSHMSYFPENLGAFSEEQGEHFHQDVKEMERRYQGFWNSKKRENPDVEHRRKSIERSIVKKRKALP